MTVVLVLVAVLVSVCWYSGVCIRGIEADRPLLEAHHRLCIRPSTWPDDPDEPLCRWCGLPESVCVCDDDPHPD